MRKIKALLWLRTNIIKSNRNMIVLLIMPYLFAYMYDKFMNTENQNSMSILFICLAMSFSFSTGNIITTLISEEKEKKNLKTLLISGISIPEYIISTLIIPIIIGILSIILLPFVTNAYKNLTPIYLNYFLVSFLTMITIIIINLLIALFSKSQSKAQINSLPLMLIVTLIPMFSSLDKSIENINNYSFMGLLTKFFNNTSNFTLNDMQLYIQLIWISSLILFTFFTLKNKKRIS